MVYQHSISLSFVVESDYPDSPTVAEVRLVVNDITRLWGRFEDDRPAAEVLPIEIFDTEYDDEGE